MKENINLQALFAKASNKHQQVAFFALICLGVIEALTSGLINVSDKK